MKGWASVSTAVVLTARVRYDDGEEDFFTVRCTHDGDRAHQEFYSADAFPKAGRFEALGLETNIYLRGQYYMVVMVDTGPGSEPHYPVFAGYVAAQHAGPGSFEDPLSGPGLKVDNEADSTLVNNTALTRTITVPVNTRWRLNYGSVLNGDDVTRVVNYLWDDGADPIGGWTPGQSATGLSIGATRRDSFPLTIGSGGSATSPGVRRVVLVAGDRILITWFAGGASGGGTAKSSAVVQEWVGTDIL